MEIFLLQQMPTVSLGPAGTVLLTVVAAILGFITWRQRTWKSTADAAVAEMNVHKSAAERLRAANGELMTRAAKLEAQTDLRPLVDSISNWVTEGRSRFEDARKRLDVIHEEQAATLRALLEEIKAQRTVSEDAYRSLTTSFATHVLEDRTQQLEQKQIQLRTADVMDALERRLSEVAVIVGVTRWKDAPLKDAISTSGSL